MTGILAIFSLAFVRTAWMSEDAFITFRTLDNALHGFGLTWNPGERVQTYTHPLWLGLLLPAVAVFGDPYYAALVLSYVLLMLALLVIGKTLGEWTLPSGLAVASLLWSRSFVDYSSSGLENPLTHALLATYLWAWLKLNGDWKKSLVLAAIVSALFLARPDAIFLVLPSLLAHLWTCRKSLGKNVSPVLIGSAPGVAWILFSLFYYGAPVPNTALAKVQTGLSLQQNAMQAWHYIEWTVRTDFITAALLVSGIVFGLLGRKNLLRPLAIGLLVWLGYLFYVGADYMGGRFFSAPTLLATGIFAIGIGRVDRKRAVWAMAILLIPNAGTLNATVFSSSGFDQRVISPDGIADERGFYYQSLGLLPALERGTWFVHPWLLEGRVIRSYPGWYTRCAIGMIAYAAGPEVQWIDPLALSEPFLSRLPSRTNARVGHYERAFPAGYLDSVIQRANLLKEEKLRALYQDVNLATRAPLFTDGRLSAIWHLNTNYHRDATKQFNREAIGLPGVPVQTHSPLSCYGIPYGWDGSWKLEGEPAKALRLIINNTLSDSRNNH
jgi:arabinofuranosyltransferase